MSDGATAQLPAAPSRRKVRGAEKAAVLMVSLGAERAAEVFKHLREDEIEALSLEMAKTKQVSPEVIEDVYAEVHDTAVALEYFAEGGAEYCKEVLERSLGPERAAEIVGQLSAVIEMRPFEFLRRSSPEQILAFLRNEGPQTIALVVANLHTTLAANVMAALPDDEQADVAARIARMGETTPAVIKDVEAVVRQKLSSVLSQEVASAGGVKALADILNQADRPTEKNVLESLTENEPELAEEVRRLLFVFEDILKLDNRSVQLVLKEVDQKDLALALRGVAQEVQDKILQNMSARGAEMLAEEIEFLPPQRRRVVLEAQGRIVGAVRRLEEAGAIVLSRGGGDDDDAVV